MSDPKEREHKIHRDYVLEESKKKKNKKSLLKCINMLQHVERLKKFGEKWDKQFQELLK